MGFIMSEHLEKSELFALLAVYNCSAFCTGGGLQSSLV